MQINDIRDEKSRLRAKYRQLRNSLSEYEREKRDELITARLTGLEQYKSVQQIFCYVSTGSEVGTHRLIAQAIEDSKAVAVPKCRADCRLDFYYINSIGDLSPGAYGIAEPREGLEKADDLSGLCIVPGLLFDLGGFRLGYGKGYYDRFLPHFDGVKVGLCFEEFLIDSLPRYSTDCRVDMIITDKNVYNNE